MANRKLSKDEMIITSKHPEWLDTLVADRHCNDKLYKIILFFGLILQSTIYKIEGNTVYIYHLADARKNYIYQIFGLEE